MAAKYGKVKSIEEDSPAWEAGIRPGDEVVAIDGHPVRDILDYSYLCTEEELDVEVQRDGRALKFMLDMSEEDDPGIEFTEDLFDGLHTCRNKCIFCFLHQMPKGLRKSLYVRDDDYRLSLAHGNYITLTNLSDEDMERIRLQRMSPIYVSVHTTDPELRICMLRSKAAGRIMEQLRFLAEARITMHTQIVLCPGVNDGENLERSVRDLASLHPWVASVGVVPVGLTKHRENLYPLQAYGPDGAREVVTTCQRWQREFRRTLGTRFVFPSDEFFLVSGIEFPSRVAYEGFPQLENGIGISRVFLDELAQVSRTIGRKSLKPGKYVLVTADLSSGLVRKLADVVSSVPGIEADVCIVKNKFLGESVTVTGLLAGQDIAEALSGLSEDTTALIPDVALNEDRFLDDMTLAELQERVKAKVVPVRPSPKAVVEYLSSRSLHHGKSDSRNSRSPERGQVDAVQQAGRSEDSYRGGYPGHYP